MLSKQREDDMNRVIAPSIKEIKRLKKEICRIYMTISEDLIPFADESTNTEKAYMIRNDICNAYSKVIAESLSSAEMEELVSLIYEYDTPNSMDLLDRMCSNMINAIKE